MNDFILSLIKYTSILICVLYTYAKLLRLKLKVLDLSAIPLFIALSAVLHFTTVHIKILVPTGILILSSAFLYLRFKRPIQETVMVNIIAFAISIAFFIFSITGYSLTVTVSSTFSILSVIPERFPSFIASTIPSMSGCFFRFSR